MGNKKDFEGMFEFVSYNDSQNKDIVSDSDINPDDNSTIQFSSFANNSKFLLY